MSSSPARFARAFEEFVEVGRKLVETSELFLAILRESEAECRPFAQSHAAVDNPMMEKMKTPVLTTTQIAELLQIGTRMLRRIRNDPRAKFPKPIERLRPARWRLSDIEAWIAGSRS